MWQTLLTPVDLYCERTGPGLWAEPANALTNVAFIAAGLWGAWQVRRQRTGGFAEVLAWWVVAIGIGSTLFHPFGSKGTIWADILPIAAFTLAYTLFNLRRFLGMDWGKAILVFVAFYAVAGLITYAVPDWLRQVASIFPLKWIAQGMRSVFYPDGMASVEMAHSWETGRTLLVLAAWAVGGLVLCVTTFKWFKRGSV